MYTLPTKFILDAVNVIIPSNVVVVKFNVARLILSPIYNVSPVLLIVCPFKILRLVNIVLPVNVLFPVTDSFNIITFDVPFFTTNS